MRRYGKTGRRASGPGRRSTDPHRHLQTAEQAALSIVGGDVSTGLLFDQERERGPKSPRGPDWEPRRVWKP